jgi:Kdo2-lipid IVA lauroyltransferase/acyltransferase
MWLSGLKKYITLASPLNWPAFCGLGLLWGITRLPDRIQLAAGKLLGHLLWLFGGKFKTITRINLSLCFPAWPAAKREVLARMNFEALGIGMIESARAWWLPDTKLAPACTIRGFEHAEAAYKKGRGIILVGPHFTCLEIIGRLIGMQHDFAVMYRPHKKPLIAMIHKRFRKKNYREYIPRNRIRHLLRVLQKNMAVWYAYDIDAGNNRGKGSRKSVFAPFFGIQTASLTALSRLVHLSGATVLPIYFYRHADSFRYTVILEPPPANFPGNSVREDAECINKALERAIKNKPEQYIWQYKRFKTRPDGEPRFY